MSGTKVTNDPEGLRNPIQEGTGFVASDSLAADSLSSGGSFAADNPNAAADPQSARGSTANTTDTSAASQLDPAPSASERYDGDQTYDTGAGAVSGRAGKSEGRGPTYNTDSGSGSGFDSGSNDASRGYSETGSGADRYGGGDVAPSYVSADRDANIDSGPKGRGLTEGGFDDSAPNASFNQDIGGKNDPGRLAEDKFDRENSQREYDAGGSGARQGGSESGNPYSTLGNE